MARSSSLYVLLCILVVPAGVFLLVAAPRRRSAGGEQRLTARRAGLEVEAAQRARAVRARNVAQDLRRFGLLEEEEEEEEGKGKRRTERRDDSEEDGHDRRRHRHRDSSRLKKETKQKSRHEQPGSGSSDDDDDGGGGGSSGGDVADRRPRSTHARRSAEVEGAGEEEEGGRGETAAQKKRRRRRQEEDKEEGGRHSSKKKRRKRKKKKREEDEEDNTTSSGSVVVGTSLKSCEPGSILCSRQWNSVQSWALCERVHAVHVFAAPGDTFDLSGIDAAKVKVHRRVREEGADDEGSGGGGSSDDDSDDGDADPHVITLSAKTRIPLLSSIVCTLTKEAAALKKRLRSSSSDDAATPPPPVTLVYANGDIVFPPHQLSSAVGLLEESFKEYFAVGHRRTAEVGGKMFSGSGHRGWAEWAGSVEGQEAVGGGGGGDGHARHDRTDAEDYFVWSDGYFPDACSFPGFRIGRPAFDNWWVHKAVVSGKPVVDLTNALAAVHQKHDYAHLDKAAAAEGGGKATNKYWATADQQRNYALGKANGGWRFGLIEFSPFVASPSDCALRNMVVQEVDCRVVPNKGWLPPTGTGLSLSGYAKYARHALAPLPTQLRPAEGGDGDAEEAERVADESEGHHRHHKGHKRHKKTHRKRHHDDSAV